MHEKVRMILQHGPFFKSHSTRLSKFILKTCVLPQSLFLRIGEAQLVIFAMTASSRSVAEKYGKRGCVFVCLTKFSQTQKFELLQIVVYYKKSWVAGSKKRSQSVLLIPLRGDLLWGENQRSSTMVCLERPTQFYMIHWLSARTIHNMWLAPKEGG